jgi:ATP-dependent protease ClpP protease subunit
MSNRVLRSESDVLAEFPKGTRVFNNNNSEEFGVSEENFFFINSGEIRIPYFRIYLDSVESSSCAKLCDMLRSVSEGSRVLLYLNNPGGDLFNTMQIVNAMNDCPGEVIAIADGKVISAGSIIFLAADKFIVKDNAFMMCHYYSGGVFGKGHEMQSQLAFYEQINKEFMQKSYKGFLSDEEFERLTKGEDFWLNKSQIEERLINMVKYDRENPIPPTDLHIIGEQEEAEIEPDPLNGFSEDDILLLAEQITASRKPPKKTRRARKPKASTK